MNQEIENLIEISHQVGQSPDLIQAGGGNTSVKSNNIMYIKASGTALKDMSTTKGYSEVSLENNEILNSERPSMEWLMHSYLPKYVIHSHSIYANVFNCMEGGGDFLLDFFSEYNPIYISYFTPGKKLAQGLKDGLNKNNNLIFLENHGLITSSSDMQESLDLNFKANNDLKKYLQTKINNFSPFSFIKTGKPDRCIFPDAAVFLKVENVSSSHEEVLAANEYIIKTIKELNETPRFLTDDQINELQNMESEQYRFKLTQN